MAPVDKPDGDVVVAPSWSPCRPELTLVLGATSFTSWATYSPEFAAGFGAFSVTTVRASDCPGFLSKEMASKYRLMVCNIRRTFNNTVPETLFLTFFINVARNRNVLYGI